MTSVSIYKRMIDVLKQTVPDTCWKIWNSTDFHQIFLTKINPSVDIWEESVATTTKTKKKHKQKFKINTLDDIRIELLQEKKKYFWIFFLSELMKNQKTIFSRCSMDTPINFFVSYINTTLTPAQSFDYWFTSHPRKNFVIQILAK